jgi:hypothetical protein
MEAGEMSGEHVNVDNFVRAETDRTFSRTLADTQGVGSWYHFRAPTPIDHQPVIRQNRDTLYSMAIIDVSDGATLSIPETGGRYLSIMVVNQDHYINNVFRAAGEYRLSLDEFETPYVMIAARILADPTDPADIAAVNALQDQLRVTSTSNTPFAAPDYDEESLTSTRNALLELARGLSGFDHTFGSRAHVDPVRHLIGTAAGWGGLPEHEAHYVMVDPGLPVGEYKIEIGDVPVDAFWSISLYNKAGYFEPNKRNLNSVNSITATKNDDGTTTVNFGTGEDEKPNYFPISEGWNYTVRLYQPRPEILDGSWTFPAIEPA